MLSRNGQVQFELIPKSCFTCSGNYFPISDIQLADVIGIGIDLGKGSMEVCLGAAYGGWKTVFESGITVGEEAGSGFYPIISGSRVELKYHFGFSLEENPFTHLPHLRGYLPVAGISESHLERKVWV